MSVPKATEIEKKFFDRLERARDPEGLDELRREFLGRKGALEDLLAGLKDLPIEERKRAGKTLNALKSKLEQAVASKQSQLESQSLEQALRRGGLDPTLPAAPFLIGRPHPLSQALDAIIEIFLEMGFGIAEGPQIETDENNFGSLNFLEDHPAKDMHDTFYVREDRPAAVPGSKLLLRTHTSPVQIREMKRCPPPLRVIAPGKVYRHEAIDATHSSVFHQVEGLAVGEAISFADLKGTLETFCRRLFGDAVRTRFRPSYFPFVEPGAEMDVSCTLCGGGEQSERCSVCKGSGWLEMLGAGMVHPNVFKAVGYDPERWTGYAFGMGVERIAMIRRGVGDMRLFYENHLDFLSQS